MSIINNAGSGNSIPVLSTIDRYLKAQSGITVSLDVLKQAREYGLIAKSGIMVGIGEREEEVIELMKDLRGVGCQLFTIGQYLQPTTNNIPVEEYVTPEQFEKYKKIGLELGFDHIESGPLVRSSYMAERTFIESKIKR